MSIEGLKEEEVVDIETRVGLGVRVLDIAFPEWHKALDLDKLNLGSTDFCVLGQLYGSYLKGREALIDWLSENMITHVPPELHEAILQYDDGFTDRDGDVCSNDLYELGFEQTTYGPCESLTIGAEYDALTGAWRERITKRKAEEAR